jgi:hypothetical protein
MVRLSKRDKVAVAVGGTTLLALCLWLFVYEPAREHITLLERKVQAKQSEYREVQDLAQRLARLNENAKSVEERLLVGKGFSVLTHLEKVALDLDLRRRITQMKGKAGETSRHFRENAIEIRMERVGTGELVRYLFLVEHPKSQEAGAPLLRVKQLRIRSNSENKNLLDATFQVSGYEPIEKS